MGLDNVQFLPTQPREILPQMLGAADISLVTLNKQLGQLNIHSKTYSIMASARPVLAGVPVDSEITRLVHEADCGVVVPPEDPKAMAEAIQDLAKQPDLLERLGSNGREYVVANFSRPMLVKRYQQLLHEVASKKKSAD